MVENPWQMKRSLQDRETQRISEKVRSMMMMMDPAMAAEGGRKSFSTYVVSSKYSADTDTGTWKEREREKKRQCAQFIYYFLSYFYIFGAFYFL